MGACGCKSKVHQSLHEYICNSFLLAIESGRKGELEQLYFRFMKPQDSGEEPVFHVDDTIIVLQEVQLNALAYAFRAGQCHAARFLIEEGKASIRKLYDTYGQIGRTPMDILCEFGFLDLVEYFFPVHMRERDKEDKESMEGSGEELSIFSEKINKKATTMKSEATLRIMSPYQPSIHRACEHGHIEVVKWLHNQFHGMLPPEEFDINAIDEKAGENCALIATRCGDFPLVRYLHEECNADFFRLNRRRENAVQVAVTGSKRKTDVSFLNIVKYLVEIVGVDITYEYEETLLICEDKALVYYLESQLHRRDILVTKSKVDLDNSLTRNRPRRQLSQRSQELDQRCRHLGDHFQLGELFPEALREEEISSIPQLNEVSGRLTPF